MGFLEEIQLVRRYHRGQLILSFDFELGWGAIENGLWQARERAGVYRDLRPILRTLVSELDALEIRATWAVVGAMIANPGRDGFDHLPDTARSAAVDFLSSAEPDTRDGRDLFDIVAGSRTAQDIGSHSYSHLRFSYPEFTAERRAIDVRLGRTANPALPDDTGSFVFPLNDAIDFDCVAADKFSIARIAPVARRRGPNIPLVQKVMGPPAPVTECNVRENLIAHSGSLLLNWGVRRGHRLKRRIVLLQAHRGLHRAIRNRTALHLWLHPFNLAETPHLFDDFLSLLRTCAKYRDRGQLDIAAMSPRPRPIN